MIWSSVDLSYLNAACSGVVCFLSPRCHINLVLMRRSVFRHSRADWSVDFILRLVFAVYRLVGLVVKASASRAEDPEFESRLRRDFSGCRVIPVTSKLALQWLPCQAPGVIGSVLGLVVPVSVYCDWVRWKVWSATSISVWQHVNLSVQIRP